MAKNSYTSNFSTRKTHQSQPILGRENDMTPNNAGGIGFKIDDINRVRRLLILGNDVGTYYVNQRQLTIDNANTVIRLINAGKGKAIVDMAVDVSDAGLARKNDAAIFVLALVLSFGSNTDKKYVAENFNSIVRIASHLYMFFDMISGLRGFGRSVRESIASWFDAKDVNSLAFQFSKYKNRYGYTARDVLRLVHPKPRNDAENALYRYITKGDDEALNQIKTHKELELLEGIEKAKHVKNEKELVKIVTNYHLTREMIPSEYLNKPAVQEAFLPNLGITALIRNLGNMTASGFLNDGNFNVINQIADRINNFDTLKKGRVHPIQILEAMKTYSQGGGYRGNLTWTPVHKLVDALNDAFYTSFGVIEPTGKNIMLAVDVSCSMSFPINCGVLTSSEVVATMALATAKIETNYVLLGFFDRVREIDISPNMRLDDVLSRVANQTFGATDAGVPMKYALENNWDIDAFCVYTDNETWRGEIHPSQALNQYRNKMNKPNAKLMVLATGASDFSIADPADPNMLDIAGFSSDVPNTINDFIAGNI